MNHYLAVSPSIGGKCRSFGSTETDQNLSIQRQHSEDTDSNLETDINLTTASCGHFSNVVITLNMNQTESREETEWTTEKSED